MSDVFQVALKGVENPKFGYELAKDQFGANSKISNGLKSQHSGSTVEELRSPKNPSEQTNDVAANSLSQHPSFETPYTDGAAPDNNHENTTPNDEQLNEKAPQLTLSNELANRLGNTAQQSNAPSLKLS